MPSRYIGLFQLLIIPARNFLMILNASTVSLDGKLFPSLSVIFSSSRIGRSINKRLMHRNKQDRHSITSSAATRSVLGTVKSSALGFEVDDKSVNRWLLKWQIARFLAAQNTADVGSGLANH